MHRCIYTHESDRSFLALVHYFDVIAKIIQAFVAVVTRSSLLSSEFLSSSSSCLHRLPLRRRLSSSSSSWSWKARMQEPLSSDHCRRTGLSKDPVKTAFSSDDTFTQHTAAMWRWKMRINRGPCVNRLITDGAVSAAQARAGTGSREESRIVQR